MLVSIVATTQECLVKVSDLFHPGTSECGWQSNGWLCFLEEECVDLSWWCLGRGGGSGGWGGGGDREGKMPHAAGSWPSRLMPQWSSRTWHSPFGCMNPGSELWSCAVVGTNKRKPGRKKKGGSTRVLFSFSTDLCDKLRQRLCGSHHPGHWSMCQQHFRGHRHLSEWSGAPHVQQGWWVSSLHALNHFSACRLSVL